MQRILIVRTSAIGDVVFAAPLASALRRSHPDAYIAWLVDPALCELLAAHPALDEVIPWPRGEWRRLWRERHFGALWRSVSAFRSQLRERRFDTALDLQGLLKSGLPTWWSGAKRRVGLGSREGSQWLMSETVPRAGDPGRISSEYLHLARHLRLDCGDFAPELSIPAKAAADAAARLAALGIAPGQYAVLAPFTTRPQKHWFIDAWQALAPQLQARFGLVPLVLGGPGERAAGDALAADARAINLAGQTRIAEAAALIAGAGLVIGVDTGLTHMGIALDRPTVALFGSTCPYTDTRRAKARVIWLGLPCSPCRRRPTCHGRYDCLRNIEVGRVLDEAAQVLSLPR